MSTQNMKNLSKIKLINIINEHIEQRKKMEALAFEFHTLNKKHWIFLEALNLQHIFNKYEESEEECVISIQEVQDAIPRCSKCECGKCKK